MFVLSSLLILAATKHIKLTAFERKYSLCTDGTLSLQDKQKIIYTITVTQFISSVNNENNS
jgi:hypothetical protein